MDKLEDKPWMILWGSKDEFITTEYLEKWKGRLPNAVVKEFPSGHFVQEEQTLQAIDEIQQFVK